MIKSLQEVLHFTKKAKKPVTRLDFLKAGIDITRTDLRNLVNAEILTKTENYLNNTIKKGLNGKPLIGTMYYTYTYNCGK